jgi:hypothetical protein
MEELKKYIEQRMGKIKENFDNPHQQPEYKQLLFCLSTINDFVEQQGLSAGNAGYNFLADLLKECHKLIQLGIYSEDGIDGAEGQELLDKIEQHIEVDRSYRDVTGLIET